MGYGETLKNACNVYLFKPNAANALVKDKSAFGLGFLTVAIGGVAGAIGTFNPVGIVVQPIFLIVASLIWVGVLHLFAKLFSGSATYGGLWNVVANMSFVGWIAVIPFLGPILMFPLGIWALIATVFAVREIHKLSTGKAVAVVLIPLAIVMVFAFIVGLIAGLALMSMFAGGMGPGMMMV